MTHEQFRAFPDCDVVRLELDEGSLLDRPAPSFLRGAPNLAVEVTYPSDAAEDQNRRAGAGETSREPQGLPGLEIPVDEIFAGIEDLKKS